MTLLLTGQRYQLVERNLSLWAGVEDQRDMAVAGFYSIDECGDVSIPADAFDYSQSTPVIEQFTVCFCVELVGLANVVSE